MTTINVLDKGYVRLIESMGSDLSIVRAARVSYDADWREGDEQKDAKLIRYLWEHKHTSPFEAVTVTFEVRAPIFIFRQWHRHRTQSYNEISARYTELEDEFYVPDPTVIGEQSKNNKQARDLTQHDDDDDFLRERQSQIKTYNEACESAFGEYDWLMSKGWPRELARMVLPLSTYSRMFATANLLNWFRFLTLRDDPHAQWEIQQYAKAVKELLRPIVPVSVGVFETTHWKLTK